MIVILFSLSFFLCWIILHLEGHEYIYEKWTGNWKDKPNFLTYKKMAKPPSPCLNGSLLWSVFSTGNKNIHCRGTTMKFCSALLWKKKRYDEKKHNNKQLYDFCKVHIPCHTYGNLYILCDIKGIHVSLNGPNLKH